MRISDWSSDVCSSDLETIRHMVAAGIGITVLPTSSLSMPSMQSDLLAYIPFREPIPDRRVVLVWRKSFPRASAIDALIAAVHDCKLSGVKYIEDTQPSELVEEIGRAHV